MRVMHVAPTAFGPAGLYGGGERYPLELARALAKHVSCELVTFGRRPRERQEGLLRVRTLPVIGHLARHPARPVAPTLPFVVRGADVVHVHQMRSPPSVVAALTARARGLATAVTDHGFQGNEWAGLVPRLFDRFLTVSRYSAEELRAPAEKTTVIYGGVDPLRYRPDTSATRSGVLFVGRLTPHKGVDVLIRALPDGASLTVVGSEGHDPGLPERNYPALLHSLASGRSVTFTGAIDDQDLARRLSSAAVLAVPSVARTCYGREVAVSELLGLVVLEAMASGTPVVASRIGGLPEIVADGVTGYLVQPGDERALREALAEVVADRSLATRMGREARRRVVDELSWDHCAQRCLSAYEDMLRARRLSG